MNAFERARYINSIHNPESSLHRTLVIIDMQSNFMDDEEYDIVPNICSLVRHARQNKWGIIVVEFDGNGDTDQEILDSLEGYKHRTRLLKGKCDGGQQIIEYLNDHPNWSLDTVVCGIYGPNCVAATIFGMLQCSDLVEVDVVLDAVCPDYHSWSSNPEVNMEREVYTNDIVHCNEDTVS